MMNEVKTTEKAPITERVLKRIDAIQKEQGMSLPDNYVAANALNSAYLALQKVKTKNGQNALTYCTDSSISKALLDMVLQGLSPAKQQCYFIVYGNELQMQRSYFGSATAVKRLSNVKDVKAYVVHEGDEFEIDTNDQMEIVVSKFHPKFANQDNPIVGAYAIVFLTDGSEDFTVMTKKEIEKSWAQTRQKNNRVQQNFSQEMAKRTVLNRAAKMFINTSDDSDLLTGAINDTTANEYDDEPRDVTPSQDEETTQQLLDSFNESQQKLAKEGDAQDASHKEDDEDKQTELFKDGTITPKQADEVNA